VGVNREDIPKSKLRKRENRAARKRKIPGAPVNKTSDFGQTTLGKGKTSSQRVSGMELARAIPGSGGRQIREASGSRGEKCFSVLGRIKCEMDAM